MGRAQKLASGFVRQRDDVRRDDLKRIDDGGIVGGRIGMDRQFGAAEDDRGRALAFRRSMRRTSSTACASAGCGGI